jgi:hypothetical protein
MRIDTEGHFEAGNLHWVRRGKKRKRKGKRQPGYESKLKAKSMSADR